MHPEDEFEHALQCYETAVREYKLAWRQYVESVGMAAAQPKLEEAFNRLCRLDNMPLIVLSQEEVEQHATQAVMMVDADAYTSPDLYAGRMP